VEPVVDSAGRESGGTDGAVCGGSGNGACGETGEAKAAAVDDFAGLDSALPDVELDEMDDLPEYLPPSPDGLAPVEEAPGLCLGAFGPQEGAGLTIGADDGHAMSMLAFGDALSAGRFGMRFLDDPAIAASSAGIRPEEWTAHDGDSFSLEQSAPARGSAPAPPLECRSPPPSEGCSADRPDASGGALPDGECAALTQAADAAGEGNGPWAAESEVDAPEERSEAAVLEHDAGADVGTAAPRASANGEAAPTALRGPAGPDVGGSSSSDLAETAAVLKGSGKGDPSGNQGPALPEADSGEQSMPKSDNASAGSHAVSMGGQGVAGVQDEAPNGRSGEAPGALPGPVGPPDSQAAARSAGKTRPHARSIGTADEASLDELLRPLLSHAGGVDDPGKVGEFVGLLEREMTLKGRILLLTIIEFTTSAESLKAFVDNAGLMVLNTWLAEARERAVAKAKERGGEDAAKNIWSFVKKILGVLRKLPADVNMLVQTKIGKSVRSVAKATLATAEVRQSAKDLVLQWKRMYITSAANKTADARPASPREKPPSAKRAAGVGAADSDANTGSTAPLLVAADDDSLFQSRKSLAPRAKPFYPPRRKVQRLSEVPRSETPAAPGQDDGPPRTGAEDAEAPVSPDREGSDQGEPETPAGDGAPAGGTGQAEQGDSHENAPEAPSVAAPEDLQGGSGGPEERTAMDVDAAGAVSGEQAGEPVPAAASKDALPADEGGAQERPKSLSIKIGTQRITPAGLHVGFRSAAQRAAEAAARIPDYDPPPREKPKAKAVKWAEEMSMVTVRLFRKEDPPAAVREESGNDNITASENTHTPGFESAAKQEHNSERRAMQLMKEHGEDLIDTLAEEVHPEWRTPPRVLFSGDQASVTVASGEDSLEAAAQMVRERNTPAASFPGGASAAWSPAEPPPLTLEEKREAERAAPAKVPWELPAACLPEAQQASLQPAGGAPGSGPAKPTGMPDSLSAMVSQMDPALVSQLQAITSESQRGDVVPERASGRASQRLWARPRERSSGATGMWNEPVPRPGLSRAASQDTVSWPEPRGAPGRLPEAPPDRPWRSPPRLRMDCHLTGRGWPKHGRGYDPHYPPEYGAPGPTAPWDWEYRDWDHGHPDAWEEPRWGPHDPEDRVVPPRADRSYWRYGDREAPPAPAPRPAPEPTPPHGRGHRGGGGSGKPCLFFNSPQGCRNGEKCPFAHVRQDVPQEQISAALTAISKRAPRSDVDAGPPRSRRRYK